MYELHFSEIQTIKKKSNTKYKFIDVKKCYNIYKNLISIKFIGKFSHLKNIHLDTRCWMFKLQKTEMLRRTLKKTIMAHKYYAVFI